MISLRRRLALLTLAVAAAAVLIVGAGSSWAKQKKPITKTALSGTWSGQYSGGYTGTFTLRWTQSGSKLTGTIKLSFPSGTYSINGSVNGSSINFGAVGAGATY